MWDLPERRTDDTLNIENTNSLSWRQWQALNPLMDKNQIRTKKDDANDAKVWALFERYDQVTHSRAPLDSTAIYPITQSPN